jgi:predicted Zn-dependent peptidase
MANAKQLKAYTAFKKTYQRLLDEIGEDQEADGALELAEEVLEFLEIAQEEIENQVDEITEILEG